MKKLIALANITDPAITEPISSTPADTTTASTDDPVTIEMDLEAKRAARQVVLGTMIAKYSSNQIFADMYQYMVDKYETIGRDKLPPPPEELITDTLDKSREVFEKTQKFFGNNFKREYSPEIIEAKINRYLWLKGIAFMILDIGAEHKIAVSYFFQEGQEPKKDAFMIDAVKYSYPDVLDVEANADWFAEMGQVMERITYRAFNVEKYK